MGGKGEGKDTAMVTARTPHVAPWYGWITFAGSMLLIVGVLNILEGIVALVNRRLILVAPDRLVAVNITGWGWTLFIFGVLMTAAGIGLFSGRTWARVTGIVIVSLHLISELGSLAAYPVWSLLMITLDVVVLYALTARWPSGEERAR